MEIYFQHHIWQKAPGSSCWDVTAATAAAKGDIIPNCLTKSLILSKQQKNPLQAKKSLKISIFHAIFRNKKRRSATQLIYIFQIKLESL